MNVLDPGLLDERTATLERHLLRIERALPPNEAAFDLNSPEADTVGLHLFQAMQLVLDLAVFACLHFGAPAPSSYDDALARLGHTGRIDNDLSDRMERVATLREAMVHAPEDIDALSLYRAAAVLPDELRSFMAQIGGHVT